ncbi:MAG TPA: AAA family ATPase, partial [Gemmatimonadaceae bacterium]|nr:AAA family ATPase [Gemmatimonadaceae bacterium]
MSDTAVHDDEATSGGREAGAADGGPRLWLRHVTVRDFRNLERVELDLPEEGIAIVGENGHGKTNLLEAIY